MKRETKQQTINRYCGYIAQLESELNDCDEYMKHKLLWKQQAANNYKELLKNRYKIEYKQN